MITIPFEYTLGADHLVQLATCFEGSDSTGSVRGRAHAGRGGQANAAARGDFEDCVRGALW